MAAAAWLREHRHSKHLFVDAKIRDVEAKLARFRKDAGT
jgi:hypothetical protein